MPYTLGAIYCFKGTWSEPFCSTTISKALPAPPNLRAQSLAWERSGHIGMARTAGTGTERDTEHDMGAEHMGAAGGVEGEHGAEGAPGQSAPPAVPAWRLRAAQLDMTINSATPYRGNSYRGTHGRRPCR